MVDQIFHFFPEKMKKSKLMYLQKYFEFFDEIFLNQFYSSRSVDCAYFWCHWTDIKYILADLNIGMSIFRNHFWSKYGKCLKITISWQFLLIKSMFYITDCLCLWAANDAQLVLEYWGCFSNDTGTFSDRYEVLLDDLEMLCQNQWSTKELVF